MELLTDDAEFAAFCEREYDVKPSEQAVKIARTACNLAMIMAEIGYRNAMEGLGLIQRQEIQRIVASIQDAGLQNEVVSLLYESYMDGYNTYGVTSVT